MVFKPHLLAVASPDTTPVAFLADGRHQTRAGVGCPACSPSSCSSASRHPARRPQPALLRARRVHLRRFLNKTDGGRLVVRRGDVSEQEAMPELACRGGTPRRSTTTGGRPPASALCGASSGCWAPADRRLRGGHGGRRPHAVAAVPLPDARPTCWSSRAGHARRAGVGVVGPRTGLAGGRWRAGHGGQGAQRGGRAGLRRLPGPVGPLRPFGWTTPHAVISS